MTSSEIQSTDSLQYAMTCSPQRQRNKIVINQKAIERTSTDYGGSPSTSTSTTSDQQGKHPITLRPLSPPRQLPSMSNPPVVKVTPSQSSSQVITGNQGSSVSQALQQRKTSLKSNQHTSSTSAADQTKSPGTAGTSIKNSVKIILNGITKSTLTPIIGNGKSKAQTLDQPQPQFDQMPECLTMTNIQSLGEQDCTQIQQSDILSALAFDRTGKYLSIGDYGGRCILFTLSRNENKQKCFDYCMEFQAHDRTIDYYSNQEIPDMVSQILWLEQPTKQSLLTCNARTIKLWSLKEHTPKKHESAKRLYQKKGQLTIPKTRVCGDKESLARLRHTFKSGMEANLHSLTLATDMQNFVSADEKSINLWSLEYAKDQAIFNVVDYNQKPAAATAQQTKHGQQLISSANFNQFSQSQILMYTTSIGDINICDFRERSNFTQNPSIRMSTSQVNAHSVYSTWLNYVSNAQFLPDQNYVVSREYLYVKMWDLRMQRNIYSAEVSEGMTRNVPHLHRADALDDEFFLTLSHDGKHMATGGYDRAAHVVDLQATTNCQVVCKHNQKHGSLAGKLRVYNKNKQLISSSTDLPSSQSSMVDSQKQVTMGAFSPVDSRGCHTMALTYQNCIYLYDCNVNGQNNNKLKDTKLSMKV